MMHLIIHMFHTSVMPNISLEEYLNPDLYTIPNTQNMRFFCCSVYIVNSLLLGCWTDGYRGSLLDCQDYKDLGHNISGVYRVVPLGTHSEMNVYCDLVEDDGGWIVNVLLCISMSSSVILDDHHLNKQRANKHTDKHKRHKKNDIEKQTNNNTIKYCHE